jgi:hypothetical protein
MPPIRSREVACAQRSGIRHRKDTLQPLDLRNGTYDVHPRIGIANEEVSWFPARATM